MKILLVFMLLTLVGVGAAIDGGPLQAVSEVGNVPHSGVVELSGVSPNVFNYAVFAKEPLNAHGLRESGPVVMQKYDYVDFPWSIRDFIDYDIEL